MKVFVAGATGAIGQPLVSALVAARHEVVGMTSSERGLRVLQKYGADGVVVNALDFGAVNTAIGRVRPDAVIEELTLLPRDYTPEAMRAAAECDRKVRLFYGPGAGLAALACAGLQSRCGGPLQRRYSGTEVPRRLKPTPLNTRPHLQNGVLSEPYCGYSC